MWSPGALGSYCVWTPRPSKKSKNHCPLPSISIPESTLFLLTSTLLRLLTRSKGFNDLTGPTPDSMIRMQDYVIGRRLQRQKITGRLKEAILLFQMHATTRDLHLNKLPHSWVKQGSPLLIFLSNLVACEVGEHLCKAQVCFFAGFLRSSLSPVHSEGDTADEHCSLSSIPSSWSSSWLPGNLLQCTLITLLILFNLCQVLVPFLVSDSRVHMC